MIYDVLKVPDWTKKYDLYQKKGLVWIVCLSFFKILPFVAWRLKVWLNCKENINISLFFLKRISLIFKDKINKKNFSPFCWLYFDIFGYFSYLFNQKRIKWKLNFFVKRCLNVGKGKFQYSKSYMLAFLFTFYLDLWKQKRVKKYWLIVM